MTDATDSTVLALHEMARRLGIPYERLKAYWDACGVEGQARLTASSDEQR